MSTRPSWAALWVLWILAFIGIEGAALINKEPGDTLSEHVRSWASIGEKSPGWRLRRFSLLAFLAWLVVHLMTGGKGRDGYV
jgi:hypothetical protein